MSQTSQILSLGRMKRLHLLMPVLLLFLLILCVAAELDRNRPGYTDKLKEQLRSWGSQQTEQSDFTKLSSFEKYAVSAGEEAIPLLAKTVNTFQKEETSHAAAYALALIGGTTARNILLKSYLENKDLVLKSYVCLAMASTGSKDDITFLMESLKGEEITDEGIPVMGPMEDAAFALGVLQARQATTLLSMRASGGHSIAASSAAEALKWINRGRPYFVNEGRSEQARIMATIFRFGIPRAEESRYFSDEHNSLLWEYGDDGWVLSPVGPTQIGDRKLPKVTWDIYVQEDQLHALVAVGLVFDKFSGSGFTYKLAKTTLGWKICGVSRRWIL